MNRKPEFFTLPLFLLSLCLAEKRRQAMTEVSQAWESDSGINSWAWLVTKRFMGLLNSCPCQEKCQPGTRGRVTDQFCGKGKSCICWSQPEITSLGLRFYHKALICLFIYVLILGPSLPDTDLCGKQQRNDSEILPRWRKAANCLWYSLPTKLNPSGNLWGYFHITFPKAELCQT